MAEAAADSAKFRRMYWGSLLTSLAGTALAVLCLRQWGSPRPWARLDLYSGGFLALALAVQAIQMAGFYRVAFRSKETAREALGLTYDASYLRWGTLLSVADLSMLLDYGHWHLVPALENRILQGLGLALLALATAWLAWTDIYLTRQFTGASGRSLIATGPYRIVRHPRYLALALSRLAAPLCFASILGWALAAPWLALLVRRVRREEAHLRDVFGAEYERYAQQRARLLPGVY